LLQVASAKLDFGLEALAATVFGSGYGSESAAQMASYVVAGKYNVNLGAYAAQNPAVLDAVLRFRDESEGVKLRSLIMEGLARSEGNEVATAVNAGLRQVVPTSVMHAANTKYTSLLVGGSPVTTPALWHDAQSTEGSLNFWRKRSREEFRTVCTKLGRGPYAQCPCGSGERVKFCCSEALGD
jgi:hypothetical protein